jgi:predicted metal-dependent phosphoesterase TrpH
LRLDTHVHTRFSYDAAGFVRAVLAAAREAGLDGLAVTDHDTVEGARRAARLAPEYGLFVLPGVEVSTAEGHLLALGTETAPAPGRPMAETAETVRDRGGVAVAAHPFQLSRHGASRTTTRGRRTPATRYVGQLVHNATLRTGGGLAQVRQLLPR